MRFPPRRRGAIASLLAFLASLFIAHAAVAQVNTEAMLSDGRSDPWSVYANFSLALTRGNTQSTRATLGGGGRWLTLFDDPTLPTGGEPWFRDRVMVSGSWALEHANDARVDHIAFIHGRWTRMWLPHVGHEIFAQANFAEFQRLNRRLLLGGGVRAIVFNDAFAQFWFGSGLFAEEEDFDLTDVENPHNYPNNRLNARWSTYVTLKVNAVDQKITLINTLYVQPTLANFGDIRVLYEGRLTARIYKSLAFSFNANVNYDSTPVPGVQKTDIRFGGAIQFRLYGDPVPVTPVHIGPTEDEILWLAMAQARPMSTHRVGVALDQARAAVQSAQKARTQRRDRAIVHAATQLRERAAQAGQRANTSLAGTRHLEAYRDPSVNAAMEASFITAAVLRRALTLQPTSAPASAAPTTPAQTVSPRTPQADDERGLFDPVVH